MRNKRRIINMLRNADEKTIEKLSAEYPQAEKNHKDEMYAKVRERMNNNESIFTDEVRGVEKYTHSPLLKIIPTAVMSLALIGGVIGGGVHMLKNNSSIVPSSAAEESSSPSNNNEEPKENESNAGNSAASQTKTEETTTSVTDNITTESTTASAAAVQTVETTVAQANAQINVTKEEIYAKCENGKTSNFDKISFSYIHREDEERGDVYEDKGEVRVNNIQKIVELKGNDYVLNENHDLTMQNDYTAYYFNNTNTGINKCFMPDSDGADNNKTVFIEPYTRDFDYDLTIDRMSAYGKELLENFDNWNITGVEDYIGRKCAVISGSSQFNNAWSGDEEGWSQNTLQYFKENGDMVSCDFTIYIDVETGVWLKSDILHTDYDYTHYTFTVTDISYGDTAKAPISTGEFRQLVLNSNCIKPKLSTDTPGLSYEPVVESDLDFLN